MEAVPQGRTVGLPLVVAALPVSFVMTTLLGLLLLELLLLPGAAGGDVGHVAGDVFGVTLVVDGLDHAFAACPEPHRTTSGFARRDETNLSRLLCSLLWWESMRSLWRRSRFFAWPLG